MSIIQRIKNLFTRKKQWSGATEYPIEFAFEYNGTEYYHFPNPFNIPYQRGMVAISIYEEFNMRMTKDFLDNLISAIDAELNKNPMRITEVMKFINILKDRLNWVIEPETVYKLASVVFFDKTESPFTYDPIYNKQKIEQWKKGKQLDFFLRLPLAELIPFLKLSPESIQTCLDATIVKSYQQLKQIQKALPQDYLPESTMKALQSQIVELELQIQNI